MKDLISVLPRHCTDCTICAIATLTGITYEKALKTILPKRKKYESYGATLEDILNCFKKLKINIIKSNSPIIKKIKRHAFVVVKVLYKGAEDYHAVVWDAKRKLILDGWHSPCSAHSFQKKVIEVLYCFEVK
jgi:ABC-type bacteriocin/lantibiotic exporter with double-glycine peptidase domain